MVMLFIVGGGLFGSLAAAYARTKGIEAIVFDPGREGAASPAAAGLFQDKWAGRKLRPHFDYALPLLQRLYDIQHLSLTRDDGGAESLLFVPPSTILEAQPIRQEVASVGDGWLEVEGRRDEGWVYIAAGIWSRQFLPSLEVYGKGGAAFVFAGERPGRMRQAAAGRQCLAFVRDRGTTYFSDGTAERDYTPDHERLSLSRAAELGLTEPSGRIWGNRPYTPHGPFFQRIASRTWLATGGRKMGTILVLCLHGDWWKKNCEESPLAQALELEEFLTLRRDGPEYNEDTM